MILIRTYKHPRKETGDQKHSMKVIDGRGKVIAIHDDKVSDTILITLLKHYDKYADNIEHVQVTHARELEFKTGLRL
ncbi:MAG: hypothetical protein RR959_06115 [Erysipelotrichaceae bacterium]